MDIVVLTETSRTENLVPIPKSLLTMEEQEAAMTEINENISKDKLDPRSKRNLGKNKKRLMVKKSLNIYQTNPVSTRGTGVAIVSRHNGSSCLSSKSSGQNASTAAWQANEMP
jgi:hypothetical protein